MAKHLRILTLNTISHVGLKRLPAERYEVGSKVERPGCDPGALAGHARDGDCRQRAGRSGAPARAPTTFPCREDERARRAGVQRAGRERQRGQGTGDRRHADGARATSLPALRFVDGLRGGDAELDKLVEDGKKHFAGIELPHRTLGIIGLGKIGSLVADAAIKLGMNVLGYDPRDHGRCGLEPAVAGEEGAQHRGSAEEQRFRHAARAAAATRRAI